MLGVSGRGSGRRLVGAGIGVAGAACCAVTAFACTSLATIEASAGSASPGESVSVAGRHFSTDATLTPIEVRDSATGSLVWSGRPDENGDFSTVLATAGLAPGYHVLVATQRDAAGAPVTGTPARVAVDVVVPGAAADPSASRTSEAAAPAASATSSRVTVVMLLLAISSAAAAAATLTVAVATLLRRRGRRTAEARRRAIEVWQQCLSGDGTVLEPASEPQTAAPAGD